MHEVKISNMKIAFISTKQLKLTLKNTVPFDIVTTEVGQGSVGQEEVREAIGSSCKYDVMGGTARAR